MTTMNTQFPPIRMVFEMTREEHPMLYDDLARFPKGTKRINRLRTLAHDGALLQAGTIGSFALRNAAGCLSQEDRHSPLTNQIFEEPIPE